MHPVMMRTRFFDFGRSGGVWEGAARDDRVTGGNEDAHGGVGGEVWVPGVVGDAPSGARQATESSRDD